MRHSKNFLDNIPVIENEFLPYERISYQREESGKNSPFSGKILLILETGKTLAAGKFLKFLTRKNSYLSKVFPGYTSRFKTQPYRLN